jgi:hypothetical protein
MSARHIVACKTSHIAMLARSYVSAKLANLLFAKELQHQLDNHHNNHHNRITSVVLHPGIVKDTNLWRDHHGVRSGGGGGSDGESDDSPSDSESSDSLEYSGTETGPCPIDYDNINNFNNNGLAMGLVNSLCDTMVCKSVAQGAATIVFACLARAGADEEEEEASSSSLPSLFQGGDFLVNCHVSNHNLGLASTSQSDDDSTKSVQLLQQQCWRNTQTMIQDAGFDGMPER